jgi:predicted ATPase
LQDRRKALLDSLKFEQINSRHRHIRDAHKRTCKWLLETPQYVDWQDPDKFGQHHGFLYIYGKPGAGKSTIMKFAVTLPKETKGRTAVISFLFHARGGGLEK